MASPRRGPAARLVPLALVGLLFLLVLVFYRKLAFTNLILADYDLLTYFYPYKEAAASALREGRLPLWNPYLFTGVPFLANPQTALLYPLNLPGYAFSAPQAVKYSVIFHVFLAGAFTVAFGRLSLALGWAGALVAALTFMFGGFMTQQVGHINQLNAAVWLPLVLLLFDLARRRQQPLFVILGGIALAVQVLAGHSQETFFLLVAFGLYSLFHLAQTAFQPVSQGKGTAAWTAGAFVSMVALGLGLSAAQLLPAWELTGESIRGSGLPYREAISFSLPPWLLARSLLPAFQESPFSEYIAYTGVLPLVLAAYAVAYRPARPLALFWLGLALLALFLALGGYNPLYELLHRLAPPLRLFRVPARWLYLYAFALACLAGLGAHRLLATDVAKGLARSLGSTLLWSAAALAPLAFLQWGAGRLGQAASWALLAAWAGLFLAAAALVHFSPRLLWRGAWGGLLPAFLTGELLVAGAFLPSNTATAPQAYDSLRPTVAQLLQDPGLYRILSISRTDFDPGDLAELRSIFGGSLGNQDLYQLIVSLKHLETLSPNLPMRYGIATLDGYDGGVLPLRRYVELREMLLEGAPLRPAASLRPNQPDALLRDRLAGIPDTQLLAYLNVKYVITDKVGDLWIDNVYYDLSTPVFDSPAADPQPFKIPSFEATAIGVVYRVEGVQGAGLRGSLAQVSFQDATGRTSLGIIQNSASRSLPGGGAYYVKMHLEGARYLQELSVRYLAATGRLVLMGMSLIDERTGASQALTLDPRLGLVHSGDLKVYQVLDWQPRAFMIPESAWAADGREALATMKRGPPPRIEGASAQILAYQPEYVQVRAETPEPAYLVLTDSYYPGWRAYLDGRETPILRALYLFRAVYLPPGSHTVEFRYEPASFRWGLALSLASLGLATGAGAWLWWRRP